VLVTRFLSPSGVGEIEDFMPAGLAPDSPWQDHLIRRVKVVRGSMEFTVRCHPAFDYARAIYQTTVTGEGATFHSPELSLGFVTTIPLTLDDRGVRATFSLQEGQSIVFVLRRTEPDGPCGRCPSLDETNALFESTVDFWHRWLSKCTYTGRWREMVHRSALTLKLLTFEPTSAIVAAPTCSLPESVGGGRN